jgi:hypothetical protein
VDRGGVTIVVDRGASMSAMVDGQPRFARLARNVAPALLEGLGPGSVDLVDSLDGRMEKTDRSAWPELVARQKRTDADTTAALLATLQPLLQRGVPTILLSDRELHLKDDQLAQIGPTKLVHDVGIIALAARPGQVMVTLRSTDAARRTLRVRSGDREVTKSVDLNPGVEQRVFVDFDAPTDLIEAALVEADDFEGDDRAWLVRTRPWPRVESRLALPDELRRMLDVYARHRPASASSPTVALARPGELKADESGVMFAPTAPPESAQGELQASPHPILTGVDLTSLTRGAALSAGGPGEGWTVLARLGGKPILAVRDGEHRQAWVGFESREFARTPSFVVLWTNLLDWAGAGGEGFWSVAPDSPSSTA